MNIYILTYKIKCEKRKKKKEKGEIENMGRIKTLFFLSHV